jgi:hypothetical protein
MTTSRSRKIRKTIQTTKRRALIAAGYLLLVIMIGHKNPALASAVIFATIAGVTTRGWWNATRQVPQRSRQRQPQVVRRPVAKPDPDKKARDNGWLPPLAKGLVAVSRECASGQHILCSHPECDCNDCFSHDEEKIMKRNREEYDAKYPDEPPF